MILKILRIIRRLFRSSFLNGDYINSFKESEKSGVYIQKVFEELKKDPSKIIKPLIMRGINHLSYRPNPYKDSYGLSDLIMFLIWIPVLIMFFLSIKSIAHKTNWILFAVIFYNFLVCLPFWGTPRLRFPVDPLFIICGCFFLMYLKTFTIKKN